MIYSYDLIELIHDFDFDYHDFLRAYDEFNLEKYYDLSFWWDTSLSGVSGLIINLHNVFRGLFSWLSDNFIGFLNQVGGLLNLTFSFFKVVFRFVRVLFGF